jgi:hypothetical protein
MPPTLKNQAQIPVPPAVRPFVRAAQVNLLVFAIAFYITFKYFWDGSISGLGFGVIVAALLAVYLAVGQGLRVAVRKRRSELTAAETSDLARHSLDVFRKQKSRAIILLCFFAIGAVITLVWAFLHRQFGAVLFVPIALLSFGLFNVWSVNRAIRRLEPKQTAEDH